MIGKAEPEKFRAIRRRGRAESHLGTKRKAASKRGGSTAPTYLYKKEYRTSEVSIISGNI